MGTLTGSIKPVQHSVLLLTRTRVILHPYSINHIFMRQKLEEKRYKDSNYFPIATVRYLHSQAYPGTLASPDWLIKLGQPFTPSSTLFG
jgi:hypothetical protein